MSWQQDDTAFQTAVARQMQLLNPLHHIWVSAHAGTGKTETLTRRIITLLVNDITLKPENILALTYTKAAAAEMKLRLPTLVTEWCTLPEEEQAAKLTPLLGITPTAQQLTRLQSLPGLLRQSPLWCQTIHGLASEILARFPTEANVPIGFRTLEESEQEFLVGQAQKKVLAAAAEDETLQQSLEILVENLGDNQVGAFNKLVVSKWDNFRQVLAAGGFSQKLEAELEATTAPIGHPSTALFVPWQSMLLAGGKRSQSHAEHLVAILAAPHNPTLWEDLFFSGKELRTNWIAGDNATRDALAAAGLTGPLEELKDTAIAWLTQHRAAEIYAITHALLIWVKKVRDAYEILKTEQGALDFNDLITKAHALLVGEGATAKAWVLYRLDRDIRHLLLDEAQDNSSPQNAIFTALADELVREDKAENPRTVLAVGDTKQSIYRFQGAAPAKFTGIRSWLTQAAPHRTTVGTLTYSFRSSANILQLADSVWHGPNDVTDPHHTVRPHAPGHVQLHLVPKAPVPEKPTTWLSAQERQQLQKTDPLAPAVTAYIMSIVGRLPLASQKGAPAKYSDILILTHRHAAAANLAGHLKAADIPVVYHPRAAEPPLTAQDYLALAQAALTPTNIFALGHVLASPLVGWSQSQLGAWLQGNLNVAPEIYAWLTVQRHTLLTQGKAAWVAARMAENHPSEESTAPHILQALLTSAEASDTAGEDITTWLERIAKNGLPTLPPPTTTPNAVRIMTVHGAKGLEAPVVILPETAFAMGRRHTDDKLLWEEDPTSGTLTGVLYHRSSATQPTYQSRLLQAEGDALLQDDRHLLYVALTRPKEVLTVFAPEDIKENTWVHHIQSALQKLGATQSEHLLTLGTIPPLQPAAPQPLPPPSPAAGPQSHTTELPPVLPRSPEQFHGTQVHALLATLPRLDRTQWAHAATLVGASPRALQEATHTLETLPQLFPPHALTEHEVTLSNGTSGRVDSLLITPESVTILDFKTDAILPESPPADYARQLQGYIAALQPHFTQPVKAVLVFTAHAVQMPLLAEGLN